ncbi:anti-sigma factor family protein [Candidatus Poribacteria bacterium]
MNCEQARDMIVEFLYDELPPERASELQNHLAECKVCMEYRAGLQQTLERLDQIEERQAPVDLAALHDAVDRKRHRVRHHLRRRWPVWATVGACFVMLLAFTLFAAEIRYEDNALTITFNGEERETLAETTERVLTTYREDQLLLRKQLADELRTSTAVLLKVIDEYESQRDRQFAEAFRQMQIQRQQMILATQGELENLASETENRLRRNYLMTMATVAELVDSP